MYTKILICFIGAETKQWNESFRSRQSQIKGQILISGRKKVPFFGMFTNEILAIHVYFFVVSRSSIFSRLFSVKYVRDIVWWNWRDMTFDCWLGDRVTVCRVSMCCVALPRLIAVLTESCAKIILESIRNLAFVCARHVFRLKTIRGTQSF